MQEDCDMEYFNIDIAAIQARCKERGDIKHVRFPVRDFDPFDLRCRLPKAVARLALAHEPRCGIAYIHCTAGMAGSTTGLHGVRCTDEHLHPHKDKFLHPTKHAQFLRCL